MAHHDRKNVPNSKAYAAQWARLSRSFVLRFSLGFIDLASLLRLFVEKRGHAPARAEVSRRDLSVYGAGFKAK